MAHNKNGTLKPMKNKNYKMASTDDYQLGQSRAVDQLKNLMQEKGFKTDDPTQSGSSSSSSSEPPTTSMLNNPGLRRLVAAKISQPTDLPQDFEKPTNLVSLQPTKPTPLQLSPSEEANNEHQQLMRKALVEHLNKNYKL